MKSSNRTHYTLLSGSLMYFGLRLHGHYLGFLLWVCNGLARFWIARFCRMVHSCGRLLLDFLNIPSTTLQVTRRDGRMFEYFHIAQLCAVLQAYPTTT